jgi:hypothetical protein
MRTDRPGKTLVAGWFSFEQMGATAGDLMTRDLVCDWLRQANRRFDIAVAPPFSGGLDWRSVDPADYGDVVFVCGPFGKGEPVVAFLERFRECRLSGVNLTMLQALEEWNPFDHLWERDSSACARPDLAFLSRQEQAPVVGLVLVHPQKEYRNGLHAAANDALLRLTESREMAVVRIDTRLDENGTGLRTPGEVEALIARMDVVLTTRLHGTVLALKNGVPAIALDPISGGAKIARQAQAVGWPVLFTADAVTDADLQAALAYCLTEDARERARQCRVGASETLTRVREEFIEAFSQPRCEALKGG